MVKEFDIKFTAKDAINDDNYNDFHSFNRKAAGHFLLFLITALVGTFFFYTYIGNDKYILISALISLFIGVLTAGVQLLIPSRSGGVG